MSDKSVSAYNGSEKINDIHMMIYFMNSLKTTFHQGAHHSYLREVRNTEGNDEVSGKIPQRISSSSTPLCVGP